MVVVEQVGSIYVDVVNQSLRTNVDGAALSLFDVGVSADFQTVLVYQGNVKG